MRVCVLSLKWDASTSMRCPPTPQRSVLLDWTMASHHGTVVWKVSMVLIFVFPLGPLLLHLLLLTLVLITARLEAEAAEAARQAGAISDSWRQPLPAPVASSSVGVASLDNGIVYGGQSRNGPGGVSLNGSSLGESCNLLRVPRWQPADTWPLVGNAGSGHGHNGYGPIAPPAPQQALQTPPTDNNRHAPLNTENDADEEDDHIVWYVKLLH